MNAPRRSTKGDTPIAKAAAKCHPTGASLRARSWPRARHHQQHEHRQQWATPSDRRADVQTSSERITLRRLEENHQDRNTES